MGGKLKGKKILLPSKSSTRSSKAILKGSVFDRLQFDIVDKIFIEVFAGSGSIGIEAISRGAKYVYFIEQDFNAHKILTQNIVQLNINNASIYYGDSFEILPKILKTITNQAYFYFDPPFSIRDNYKDIYNKLIDLIINLQEQNIIEIIIEYQTGIKFPELIGNFKLLKHRKFGKSSLNFYGSIKT